MLDVSSWGGKHPVAGKRGTTWNHLRGGRATHNICLIHGTTAWDDSNLHFIIVTCCQRMILSIFIATDKKKTCHFANTVKLVEKYKDDNV